MSTRIELKMASREARKKAYDELRPSLTDQTIKPNNSNTSDGFHRIVVGRRNYVSGGIESFDPERDDIDTGFLLVPKIEHSTVFECSWFNVKNGRHYEARIQQNLFGKWEVFKGWGGTGTNSGSTQIIAEPTLHECIRRLVSIHKERVQHGYYLCGKVLYGSGRKKTVLLDRS